MDLEQQFSVDRVEARSVALSDVDLDGDGLRFSGYAAVFDSEADLGEFTEEIRRGAFRKVLSTGQNVPMYWDHDARVPPLATTRSGTLKLREDATGLHVQAELDPDHYMTPTLRSMIRRGDVSGMSFGFVAGKGNSQMEMRNGRPHRTLLGFKSLLDVSPTWDPAYDGTSAELRSALAEIRSSYAVTAAYASPPEQRGHEQRIDDGEDSQIVEGAPADSSEPLDEQQEQRSEVDDWEIQAAARARHLRLLGIELPK